MEGVGPDLPLPKGEEAQDGESHRFQEHILDNTPMLPFGPLSSGLFWTPTISFSMIVV